MPQVRLLGPVDVVDDDGTVSAPGSSIRRSILALLALGAGRVVDSEQLLDLTWDGDPPGSGLRALRFHVSRLRAEVGVDDLVVTVGSGYRMDASTDVGVVEAALAELDGEPDLAALESLWRGRPLADCRPAAHIEHEQQRLDELRLTFLERSYRRLLEEGDTRILGDLTRLCLEHPLREALWATLISGHYRAGHQAEALRLFKRLRLNLRSQLGIDPSPALGELERQILAHDRRLLTMPTSEGDDETAGPESNLRPMLSSFVGRDEIVGEVLGAIDEHRAVTLIGVGGVGKTRLALEVGLRADRWTDGVWMVELQSVEEADDVPAAVARTLRISQVPGATMSESIRRWAQPRAVLLILDNCEHVLRSVASLAETLTAGDDGVTVLATSREPLRVHGEHVVFVPPLDVEGDERGEAGAVELFVDRACAELSTFDPQADRSAIEDVCRRLDGIPLAVELAATRVRGLSVVELAKRLDERFRLLTAGRSAAVGRHASLRATIDWSYELLDDTQRLLFDDVSVFAGPFELEDAIAIAADDVDEVEAVDALAHLVDRCLVVRGDLVPEYRLLETIRAYGRDRLAAAGRADLLARRHVALMVDKAKWMHETAPGPREAEIVGSIRAQMPDFAAAVARAVGDGELDTAVRIAADLTQATSISGEHEQPTRWMTEIVEHPISDPATAAANRWMAAVWCMFFGGDLPRAKRYADEGAALDSSSALARILQAFYSVLTGEPGRARLFAAEAQTLAANPAERMFAFIAVGNSALEDGDLSAADAHADRFVSWAEGAAYPMAMAMAYHLKARALREGNDRSGASRALERALSVVRELPDSWVFRLNMLREVVPLVRRESSPRSRRVALDVLQLCLRHNETGNAITTYGHVAMLLFDAGRYEMAARAVGACGRAALAPTDACELARVEEELRRSLGGRYEQLASEGASAPRQEMTQMLVAELRSLCDGAGSGSAGARLDSDDGASM